MIINVDSLSKIYKSRITTQFLRDLFLPTYRENRAVDSISFKIKRGESVALLGPNGAGKTTIMKMLTGLMYPSSGSVTVLGHIPFKRDREFLMKIGLVMGNKNGLDWDLTPKQSFDLVRKIYHISDVDYKTRVKQLTLMLHVQDYLDVQVRRLSLGQRMKMEIIGAILHNPEVLFLDEPTIGLDVVSKQTIRTFLREIQSKSGVTLLLTSHDMDDVEKVCDRVIIINRGIKVYDNTLEKLMMIHNKTKYVKFTFDKVPVKIDTELLGDVMKDGEYSYIVKTSQDKVPRVLEAVTSKYKPVDINIDSVPLDEIIAKIYTAK